MPEAFIVIVATNSRYKKMAEKFVASAKEFAWDVDFLILGDDDGHRGRLLKTTFAKYVPSSCTSKVILADADCLATGPLSLPEITSDVAAIRLLRKDSQHRDKFKSSHRDGSVYDTFFLVFPDVTKALTVCGFWHSAWVERYGMDMPAFNAAGCDFDCEPLIEGTRSHPTPYLNHLVKDSP